MQDELKAALEDAKSARKVAYDCGEELSILETENDFLVSQNEIFMKALQNISSTAQAASQSNPEQFCEWAFHCAQEALHSTK